MLDWVATHADTILAAVSAVFATSLVPTVWTQWRERHSTVPLSTSVLTFVGLAVIVVVYAALGLWFAVSVGSLTATTWAVIAVQRLMYGVRT